MERSRLYKNQNKDGEELRRRRNDQSVELRKAKKDDHLQKRRNINVDDSLTEISPLKERNIDGDSLDYDEMCKSMRTTKESSKFTAVQMCRRVLSRAKNPPIDQFTSRGAVQSLISCLGSSNKMLVFEATWALTNIASGESKHTRAVVEGGAVPILVELLDEPVLQIAEQSVWALGNIAGDGAEFRDLLIKTGVVLPLIRFLDRVWTQSTIVGNVAWMMSNLCRNKDPPPPRDTVRTLLPVLKKLLYYQDGQVIQDTAWALSYASDAANDFIQDIIEGDCVKDLVQLLSSEQASLISPALRAVGNLVTGSDDQTQAVLDAGLLDRVVPLMGHSKPAIVKEACWMISNITAGTQAQITAVIEHNVIPAVITVIEKSDFKSQKEAVWAVSNLINGGSPEQVAYLMNHGVLEALASMMLVAEPKIVCLVLEGIKKLLDLGQQFGQLDACCVALETCGGLDKLEQLQDHENERVYKAAYDIIDQYFQGDDTEEAKPEEPKETQELEFAPPTVEGQFNF